MICENLHKVLESIETTRIRYNSREKITLVAVSKYSTQDDILQAYQAGQTIFGENKVQDLSKKSNDLAQYPLHWHFIGTLQENKINTLLKIKPQLLHSLHSYNLALALQKRLQNNKMQMHALLQINVSNESTKYGFDADKAYDMYRKIQESCPNIILQGLMCMGANVVDSRIIEQGFLRVRKIFDKLQKYGATTLSMGMSNDYDIAIKCGSNCVRIGSSIFK